jgi:hypothetical protein
VDLYTHSPTCSHGIGLNELSTGTSLLLHLLNVHSVSDVKQIEEHTAETLLPGPHPLQVEIAVSKTKTFKSAGTDRVLAERESEALDSGVHTLMNYI